jgi:hypothetical protein
MHTTYPPTYPPWFDNPNNIWRWEQIINIITQFSPFSCYFLPYRSKCSPEHSVLKTLDLC